MKQKISAIAVLLVIFFQFWPQKSGYNQITSDTILSKKNEVLMQIRNEMVDSIKVKTERTRAKQSRIDIQDTPDGTKVIYIHDTVYLSFWRSLFQIFKHNK